MNSLKFKYLWKGTWYFVDLYADNTALAFELFEKRNKTSKWVQCTGLKSSDGGCGLPVKDAYFGDIIRFYNTDGEERQAEIIWYELEQCIGFKRLSDGFVYTQRMFNDSGYFQPSKIQFQIIGNIYEK